MTEAREGHHSGVSPYEKYSQNVLTAGAKHVAAGLMEVPRAAVEEK